MNRLTDETLYKYDLKDLPSRIPHLPVALLATHATAGQGVPGALPLDPQRGGGQPQDRGSLATFGGHLLVVHIARMLLVVVLLLVGLLEVGGISLGTAGELHLQVVRYGKFGLGGRTGCGGRGHRFQAPG